MLTVVGGTRNVYRNPTRAMLVVLVLGLSVGFFMTMLWGSGITAYEARNLMAEAGTRIAVNVAGNASGYVGTTKAGELPADVSRVVALPHVVKVERYVKRPFVNNKMPDAPSGVLIGVEPGATLRLQSMGGFTRSPTLIAGREFGSQDRGKSVAIVGEVFARSRSVGLGDEFVLPAEELERGRWHYSNAIKDLRAEVVGVYRVGVVYGDSQMFVPVDTAQTFLGIARDRVSQYIVSVDLAENVPGTAETLRRLLGPGVDVISNDAAALQTARLLQSASVNSQVGAAAAGGVGALVVLLTMLIATRERTREIGVLKAIGASNLDIAALFAGEALTLAVLSGGLGVLIYALGGPTLANFVAGPTVLQVPVNAGNSVLGMEVAWGFGLTMGFGLVGSLFAVWRAVRMRPSDAMRQQ